MSDQNHKTYKGKFSPKFPDKYRGTMPIVFRSSWEYLLMKWLDENNKIIHWSSESVIVPYLYRLDQKMHRYFVDFEFKYEDGRRFLIEVKPKKYTRLPEKPKRQTKRYLEEIYTYTKNEDKWLAAKKYAEERGWIFAVWTEETLRQLGIKIL